MADKRDDSLILDILDDTQRQLQIFQARVIDAEAIMHAAALALEQVPEPSTEAEHYIEMSRAKSLATSAAAVMRELLDEVSTLIAEFEGSWMDDPVES